VVCLEEFTEGDMALIAAAEVPAEHAHPDAALRGWKP